MLKEQEKTVQIFRKCLEGRKQEKLVIYGTGMNAEAVVRHCPDYRIEGLMDAAKTGEVLWGMRVLSCEETVRAGVGCVVVVARPAVHTIIYKRIKKWSEENGITVCDIYGNNLADKERQEVQDFPYFHVSCKQLLKEIDAHEIISFDIFDTVLMRRVCEPADVFSLVDQDTEGSLPLPFSEMRKLAEQELLRECEPDIYQIYTRIGEKYGLSRETCTALMERELQKEREVLIVRDKMKECMAYCKTQGKQFYFVSDMYLPSEILGRFLEELGITGYAGILVSCEHHMTKSRGLFRILKEKAGGKSYLHIGDHADADYRAAMENGIDAFLVMPAIRMLEISVCKDVLAYRSGVGSSVMAGMFAAKLLNNPFALYESEGKPAVRNARDFGFLFIGPLLVSFLSWMPGVLERDGRGIILFSARDGWLVRQAYHILKTQWRGAGFPEDIYFLISRRAVLRAAAEPEGSAGMAYRKYLESLKLDDYEKVYFFDFMSRGTCQAELETILERKVTGLYFQKSASGDAKKDALKVHAYFKEDSAQGSDRRIFAICDFLECVFSSYWPSFKGMDAEGNALYEKETRSAGQLACLKEIHGGVLEYCACFSKIVGKNPGVMPPLGFCDEILKYTGRDFTQTDIPGLETFMLDDGLYGNRNVGMDLLA